MDMNRLRYFCTVSQTSSISEAAKLLYISQPALSKAIKLLEEEIGQKLIVSSGRGISITDKGRELAKEAAPLLERLHSLKNFDFHDNNQKKISLTTFEVFSTYFLGDFLAKNFEDYSVKVSELTPGLMEEAIVKGQADIGITYMPIPKAELDILKITSLKMGIFGQKEKFKNVDISMMPFVIPSVELSEQPSKARGLDGWPDNEIPRLIKYEVGMMETALDLCRQGKCVGYFPNFVIKLHNRKVKLEYELDLLPAPKDFRGQVQDVYMIKRKSDLESSNFKKLSKALRQLS